MLKKILIPISVSILLAIASCGGGGGDSDGGGGEGNDPSASPVHSNITFLLFAAGFLNPGYLEEYVLSGSNTTGTGPSTPYTGNLLTSTQAQSNFNASPAVPVDELFSFGTDTQIFSRPRARYLTPNVNYLEMLGYDSNTTATSTTVPTVTILDSALPYANPPRSLPASAQIGDSGHMGDYLDSNSQIHKIEWLLADAGDGRASLIITDTIYVTYPDILATEEDVFLIDPNGDRVSLTRTIRNTQFNTIVTLSGNNAWYQERWYQDADGDGFGDLTSEEYPRPDDTWVRNGLDCNDSDADSHPGAMEIKDGMDNDCDGEVDNGNNRIVFVTATPRTGNLTWGNGLSGLAGADAQCQDEADAAGLPGTYAAWLSTSMADAIDRVTVGGHNSYTYLLPDKTTVVASGSAQFTSGTLSHYISQTAAGNSRGTYVWTGTDTTGVFEGANCADWTLYISGSGSAHVGFSNNSDSGWTSVNTYPNCDILRSHYCFQTLE